MNIGQLLQPAVQLAAEAGAAILEVYRSDFSVEHKDDNSPLTRADMAAHRLITAGLRELTPDLPQISEEGGLPAYDERRQWTRYWLIDPLDGTREFVNRNDEFTVNIALIERGRPILGVVHVPVLNLTYSGVVGGGASLRRDGGKPEPIHVAERTGEAARIVGSRSHRGHSLDALLDAIGEHVLLPMGSSLKFCRIAEGAADFYPRLGPTSEWDTAAAQAVVEQAGGAVLELDGSPLLYNAKDDILNPHFLVVGPGDRDWVDAARAARENHG